MRAPTPPPPPSSNRNGMNDHFPFSSILRVASATSRASAATGAGDASAIYGRHTHCTRTTNILAKPKPERGNEVYGRVSRFHSTKLGREKGYLLEGFVRAPSMNRRTSEPNSAIMFGSPACRNAIIHYVNGSFGAGANREREGPERAKSEDEIYHSHHRH